MGDLINQEHSFYNCIINIEQLYQGGKIRGILLEDKRDYLGKELVIIFNGFPNIYRPKYFQEAKDILCCLQGTETIITELEGIINPEKKKL